MFLISSRILITGSLYEGILRLQGGIWLRQNRGERGFGNGYRILAIWHLIHDGESTCLSFCFADANHGKSFDLPFLKKRMEHFKLQLVDDNLDYVDLFLVANSLRNIFKLENYKQKTQLRCYT